MYLLIEIQYSQKYYNYNRENPIEISVMVREKASYKETRSSRSYNCVKSTNTCNNRRSATRKHNEHDHSVGIKRKLWLKCGRLDEIGEDLILGICSGLDEAKIRAHFSTIVTIGIDRTQGNKGKGDTYAEDHYWMPKPAIKALMKYVLEKKCVRGG